MLVITLCLAFLCLVLLTEVTATGLLTVEGVVSDELTHDDEVAEVDSLVKLYVETFLGAWHEEVGVEFLAELLHELQAFLKSFLGTTHTYMLPEDVTELLVDRVNGTLTLDVEQTCKLCVNCLLCLCKLWHISRETWPDRLVSEVVLDSVREYEVTISKTLHESGSTETVCTVVREVTLTDSEEAWDCGHKLVVHPDTAHGIVDSWEDHHWLVVVETTL